MKVSDIELPSNKKFGYFLSFVLFCSSLFFFFKNLIYLSLILSVLFFSVISLTIKNPDTLSNLNKYWMVFGAIIGKFVSIFILALIFFLIFSPISYVMKLTGRDELNLKNKYLKTMWKTRKEKDQKFLSFYNQF